MVSSGGLARRICVAAINNTLTSSVAPAIAESSLTREFILIARPLCYAPAATFALRRLCGAGSSLLHPENTPPVRYNATVPATIIVSAIS